MSQPVARASNPARLIGQIAAAILFIAGLFGLIIQGQNRASLSNAYRERMIDTLDLTASQWLLDQHLQSWLVAPQRTEEPDPHLAALRQILPDIRASLLLVPQPDGSLAVHLQDGFPALLEIEQPIQPEMLAAVFPGTPPVDLAGLRATYVERTWQSTELGPAWTGFVPLRAANGDLQAVLWLELDASPLLTAERQSLYSFLSTYLVFMVISLVLSAWLARSLVGAAATAPVAAAAAQRQPQVESPVAATASPGGTDLQAYARRLEQEVAQRTQALQAANQALSQRAIQLQISSELAQQIGASLDPEELLTHLVRRIQRQFDYNFVGIWLEDEPGSRPRLRAAQLADETTPPPVGLRLLPDQPGLVGGVWQSGDLRQVMDVTQCADYVPLPEYPEAHTQVCLPIRQGGGVIGVLDIRTGEESEITPEDISLLQTLSDQIAPAIRNAQLYGFEQQRRQLAESLEQTGRELTSSLEMSELPGRVLEQLHRVVPFERGSVMLQSEHELEIIAQRGFPDDERARSLRMPIRPDDVYEQMVNANRPIWIEDVSQVAGWKQVEWLPLNRSWLGAPLITKDRVIGMISLTRPQAGAFSQHEAGIVMAFAGQAAIALENARLVTEITTFSERLERAFANLERLDQAKADFIDVAAHELRTPLTVIKGYIQVIQARPAILNDPETNALLERVLEGTARLHEVINSMLDVSKIDNQTLRMHLAPTWLNMVLRRVQGELKFALSERKISLTFSNLENLPYIQADSDLLYKVFYHLIVNAIKFTPDGGAVIVTGSSILGEDNRPWIEITVSDTGIGIDPAHHDLIFEKFYQTGQVSVHSSGRTKFKGGGPGLGLAIARGVVAAHGGKIWVESPGCDETTCPGSRFFVRLPVKTGTGALTPEAAQAVGSDPER